MIATKKGLAVTKLTSLLLTITKKKLQQASRNKVFSFDNYRYLNYIIDCWYRVPLLRGHLLKMDKASQKKIYNQLKHNRGNNMTKKTENKNTITVAQSNKLGLELHDIMTGMQGLRSQANLFMIAKNTGADNGVLRHEMDKFLEHIYDMAEIYSRDLDKIAFYLLECDNPEELRAYEAEEIGE